MERNEDTPIKVVVFKTKIERITKILKKNTCG
jgi:hypothetical protein